MPAAHRRYTEWSPERFEREAGELGPNTAALIRAILASRPHPEQGFRTCRGVLKLFRGPNRARAEAVSARALEIGAYTGSCPRPWCRNGEALMVSGWPGRDCQAATAGRLTRGSSPSGAMVSRCYGTA